MHSPLRQHNLKCTASPTGAGAAVHPSRLAVRNRVQRRGLVGGGHAAGHGLGVELAHQLSIAQDGLEGLVTRVDACTLVSEEQAWVRV